jgi:hypothetical protein
LPKKIVEKLWFFKKIKKHCSPASCNAGIMVCGLETSFRKMMNVVVNLKIAIAFG